MHHTVGAQEVFGQWTTQSVQCQRSECARCLVVLCWSVAKSFPTPDLVDYNMPGSSVLHCLLEFAQVHVHWVDDAIQPSHLLSPPSPLAFNLSQYQGLFQ